MDQAQLQSVIRSILIAVGATVAGTWLSPYFTAGNIEMVVGILVAIGMAIWGHQASTPIALAQKLVANPFINNTQAGQAIMAGIPERVVVQAVAQPQSGGTPKQ